MTTHSTRKLRRLKDVVEEWAGRAIKCANDCNITVIGGEEGDVRKGRSHRLDDGAYQVRCELIQLNPLGKNPLRFEVTRDATVELLGEQGGNPRDPRV